MFPALDHAIRDHRLGDRALRIYRYLVGTLDFHEFRPVKLLTVAAELRMRRNHASKAIRQLVQLGYLRQGERAWPGGPYEYQLIWSLRDVVSQTVTPQVG